MPSLIGRLGQDIVTLLDTKLGLLKLEIKEDVNAYVRGRVSIGVGGIIAAVGFLLLNVAIAFLVSALFEKTLLSQPVKYALGFLITGMISLIIGAAVIIRARDRLAKRSLVPERSIEELEKDKRWLKREP
ncbi:MAG: phage holin family protein [Gammaproteobacteria bacterium]|nr:phage holin family protein [Gammaproteobacteria bacterium]